MRYGKALLVIVVLAIISPVFGVILADAVGYHEPLDVAAETLGLKEEDIEWGSPLPDYSVPGLDPVTGYIRSGIVGAAVVFGIAYLLSRVSKKE